MNIVWCIVFLGAALEANPLTDPHALAFPALESIEIYAKKTEENVVRVVMTQNLDVIGVCAAAARYGNYRESPDALVMHNVILDGPFKGREAQFLMSEQSHNASSIISEQGLNTLIRNLHVDGV